MRQEAPEAPQEERHVGPEAAAVDVRLVEHQVTQVLQHVAPFIVRREDRVVQHVGVRQEDVAALQEALAVLFGGVAVEGADAQAGANLSLKSSLKVLKGYIH